MKFIALRFCFFSCLIGLLLACQLVSPASLSSLPSLQQQRVHTPSTLTGHFRSHRQVRSRFLEQSRDVLVYLPPDYEQNLTRRYPVLYMHDGNNLFDRRTAFGGQEWQVDERMETLIRAQIIEPVIVVGVYNTPQRMAEYTWEAAEIDGQLQGGQGAQYARFLVEELKPLIDKTYRTRPEREYTAVMGSSLGGLISFYLGLHYPQIFSKIGLMSPSIWWKERAILKEVPKLSLDLTIWLDMGTQEGQNPQVMLKDAQDLAKALEKRGFQHFKNLAFHIAEGAGHNEAAWAARLEHPLRFFYSSKHP